MSSNYEIKKDIEPSLLTQEKKKTHYQSGLLYSLKTSDMELDALRNYLRVDIFLVIRINESIQILIYEILPDLFTVGH